MYISLASKGKNQFWRYLVSVIVFLVASLIGQIPLTLVVASRYTTQESMQNFLKNLNFELIGISPLVGLILIAIPFAFLLLAVIVSVVNIHERPLLSLLTSRKKYSWSKTFFAIVTMLILMILSDLVFRSFHPDNYEFNAGFEKVLPLAIVALLFLPFQTSAEEFLMRGYLMQGFGLLFRFRWISLLITAIIFGALHFQNPEVSKFGFGLSMIYYIGFGLFMGILVLMDEGLELALGIHFIVNYYSVVFVTYPDSALVTPALFRIKTFDPVGMTISFGLTAIIFLIIVAVRYKWKNWSKLLRPYNMN